MSLPDGIPYPFTLDRGLSQPRRWTPPNGADDAAPTESPTARPSGSQPALGPSGATRKSAPSAPDVGQAPGSLPRPPRLHRAVAGPDIMTHGEAKGKKISADKLSLLNPASLVHPDLCSRKPFHSWFVPGWWRTALVFTRFTSILEHPISRSKAGGIGPSHDVAGRHRSGVVRRGTSLDGPAGVVGIVRWAPKSLGHRRRKSPRRAAGVSST